MESGFCRPREFAALTGRSVETVKREVKAGRIPHVRLGRAVLIPLSFLEHLEAGAYGAVRSLGGEVSRADDQTPSGVK